MPGADVIVLLGSSWARLEHHNTRWRAVLRCWAKDDRVASLRVVDFPHLSPKNLVRSRTAALASWDPRITATTCRVAVWGRTTPLDALAWRAAGNALSAALPAAGGRRVVIAATPLWVPVLRHVSADQRGFDAVDDWRFLPSVARYAGQVVAGYNAAATVDSASTVSPRMAATLRADFGVDAQVIQNGVDLEAFAAVQPPRPEGLPAGPFAVYVGVIQERVDLELLAAASSVMPVVVAGPASGEFADKLRAMDLTWLGPVEAASVPALLRAASVGLLPHKVDRQSESMNPMKVLEYLAAGLPVVATPVPTDVASPRLLVARDAAAFREAVQTARDLGQLPGPDPSVVARSWKSVADALYDAHIA